MIFLISSDGDKDINFMIVVIVVIVIVVGVAVAAVIIVITGFLFALSAYSFKHFEIHKWLKTVQKMQTRG